MPLIGKVGESDVASQLPSHHVSHVAGRLSGSFWVSGADGLGGDLSTWAHGVGALIVW